MSEQRNDSAANYDGSFIRWLMGRSPAPTAEDQERWERMMRDLSTAHTTDTDKPDLRNGKPAEKVAAVMAQMDGMDAAGTPRLEVDTDAGAAYVVLSQEAVTRTVELADWLMVDLDAHGGAVGVELLSIPTGKLEDES